MKVIKIIETIHPDEPGKPYYWNYCAAEQTEMAEGFIAAWPIGGGFSKKIPKAHVTKWDTELPSEYRLVSLVLCDGHYGPPEFKAYVNPHDNWNGWAKPLVDEENLKRFIAEQDRLQAEAGDMCHFTTGKLEGKTLVVDYGPDYEESGDPGARFTRVEPEGIMVHVGNGEFQQIEVWDISLGLIWEVEEEPAP